jgi:replicative DNA helicase
MAIITKVSEQTKQAIRKRLKVYMDMTLQPAQPREKNHYCCPFCGSRRGLSYDPKHGGLSWRCFGCEQGGDAFTLYALQHDINLGTKEGFHAAAVGLANALNLPFVETAEAGPDAQQEQDRLPAASAAPDASAEAKKANRREAEANPDAASAEAADRAQQAAPIEPTAAAAAEYIARCAAYLHSEAGADAQQYLFSRGISAATAAAFNVGYDPTRGIVLPNGAGGYQTRSIDPACQKADRYRRPAGCPVDVLTCLQDTAADPTVWIVEGELDALSIWQAGGSAIAISGAANTSKLPAALAAIATDPDALQPILWLDNDPAGLQATTKARQALQQAGYRVRTYAQDPAAGKLDPNDLLQQDPEKLQDIVLRPDAYTTYRRYNAAAVMAEADAALLDGKLTRCRATGFKALDALLDGGLYGGLYTIGAISSAGKTTLCLQIGDYIASQEQDVLIISQEMQAAELALKSLSRITYQIGRPCSYRDIVRNAGSPDATIDAARAAYLQQIAPWLYIREGIGDTSAADIRAYIQEHIGERGCCPVVIIDYLQALCPPDPRLSDKQAIDNAILQLKRCARDFNTPILAISSLNRASYQREISFEGFKEAGSIEYGSDVVLGLQYVGQGQEGFDLAAAAAAEPRCLQLRVLKNRFGRLGSIDLAFCPAFNCFAAAAAEAADRAQPREPLRYPGH